MILEVEAREIIRLLHEAQSLIAAEQEKVTFGGEAWGKLESIDDRLHSALGLLGD